MERLPTIVRRDQLGVRIHRNEHPLVADFSAILTANAALLLANKRPDFIALYIATIQVAKSRVQQLFAAFTRDFQEPHDGVPIQPCKPFCAANRATFKQASNRTLCRVGLRKHRVTSQFLVRFTEGGITGSAAPALNSAFPEVSKTLAVTVVTANAGHILLAFLTDVAVESAWVGIAAHPACRLDLFVGSRQRQGVILAAPEGFQPSISPFTEGVTTCEWAEPQNWGIHRFAPVNAPRSFTQRWPSKHLSFPFAWDWTKKIIWYRVHQRRAKSKPSKHPVRRILVWP
jgi:hypothetical protein